jgi:hypothetical protein
MAAIADYCSSKLRNAAGRYREAKRSLHAPASAQSRHGLDWMNFFIADVQTGFGSFVAFYLAQLGWSPAHIGLALSVGAWPACSVRFRAARSPTRSPGSAAWRRPASS